jgi:hypothetical protein
MGEICGIMIQPSRDFTGGVYPYEVDLNKGAVYYNGYHFLVRTDVWMNNILEHDEFSKWVNRVLYVLKAEADNDIWDYDVCQYLESLGIEIESDIDYGGSGYTYNSPDYCFLDRDIHYTIFRHDGEYYMVFRVHHGADARVGFGELACFKIRNIDYIYDSMEIRAYDSVTDKDIDIGEVEEIAEYNKEADTWKHKETGNEIYLHSSADGY